MGESRSDLRITKAGNRRLRTELVELSWRLLLYQPDDYLVKNGDSFSTIPKRIRAHEDGRLSPLPDNFWWIFGVGKPGGERPNNLIG